jgi:hypothetical protein
MKKFEIIPKLTFTPNQDGYDFSTFQYFNMDISVMNEDDKVLDAGEMKGILVNSSDIELFEIMDHDSSTFCEFTWAYFKREYDEYDIKILIISDLFIKESFRDNGIASMALDELKKYAYLFNCDYICLKSSPTEQYKNEKELDKKKELLDNFYLKNDFIFLNKESSNEMIHCLHLDKDGFKELLKEHLE